MSNQIALQWCNTCVMNSSVGDIAFDINGQCNYCKGFLTKKNRRTIILDDQRLIKRQELLQEIKKNQKRKYNCVLGLSGGVDSSYVLHLAKEMNLSPLVVHLDNGWNSELAVNNMERLLKGTGFDLKTYVLDWGEYKDLQRSFIRANVIDIELLMDHAMLSVLYKTANKYSIKHILTGINNSTVGLKVPKGWAHFKFDGKNIVSIHKQFGEQKLSTYPYMKLWKYIYYRYFKKIQLVPFLDYVSFDKNYALNLLSEKYGYRAYEKKHYENIFTRFYQGHILPTKFKVDKRLVHYSNLICTSQMTREEALRELKNPPYSGNDSLRTDYDFVLKKLKMSQDEFEDYLKQNPVSHLNYKNEYKLYRKLRKFLYKY